MIDQIGSVIAKRFTGLNRQEYPDRRFPPGCSCFQHLRTGLLKSDSKSIDQPMMNPNAGPTARFSHGKHVQSMPCSAV